MELPKIRGHYFHVGVYSVRFEVFTVLTKKPSVHEDVQYEARTPTPPNFTV